MATYRNQIAVTIVGAFIGLIAYHIEGPLWLYVVACAVFLLGLLSFSIDSPSDRSGYGKRADDSRDGFGGGGQGAGSGEC